MEDSLPKQMREKGPPLDSHRWLTLGHLATRALVIFAVGLFVYGLVWNLSTRRYLKGFSDAIVPLEGSEQERTEALLRWFRHEPQRLEGPGAGIGSTRDTVIIVRNARLLKICGSATNAFINLAGAAGLKTRRLLLLSEFGTTMHVVAEVKWGDRWVVVDPQQGGVFRNHLGRALSKEELRDPTVFRDAISDMPGYNPEYTFKRTNHIHLRRIPLGSLLRRSLTRFFPGWEEAVNWGFVPENPSLWPILISIPLFFLGILLHWLVGRYGSKNLGIEAAGLRERLMRAGHALVYRSE